MPEIELTGVERAIWIMLQQVDYYANLTSSRRWNRVGQRRMFALKLRVLRDRLNGVMLTDQEIERRRMEGAGSRALSGAYRTADDCDPRLSLRFNPKPAPVGPAAADLANGGA